MGIHLKNASKCPWRCCGSAPGCDHTRCRDGFRGLIGGYEMVHFIVFEGLRILLDDPPPAGRRSMLSFSNTSLSFCITRCALDCRMVMLNFADPGVFLSLFFERPHRAQPLPASINLRNNWFYKYPHCSPANIALTGSDIIGKIYLYQFRRAGG